MKYPYLFLTLLLTIGACQRGIDIQNFDEQAFKDDLNGCSGIRENMQQQLFENTSQLKGLSQSQIRATLGTPDRQELAERNQKYFIYFIEPSPQCNESTTNQEPLTMYIRFSAVDRATEISFKNY